jgi:arginine repressor
MAMIHMQFNASVLSARLHDFGLAKIVEAGGTAYYCLRSIDITIHRQGKARSMSYPQTNLGTGMRARDKGKQE